MKMNGMRRHVLETNEQIAITDVNNDKIYWQDI